MSLITRKINYTKDGCYIKYKNQKITDEDDNHFYNYNCINPNCYLVAGGGLMSGNAYATVDFIDNKFYFTEHGKNGFSNYLGTKIIFGSGDDRRADGTGLFWIKD